MGVSTEFRQPDVGALPDDWRPRPLKELSAFITKGSTPTTYGFKWEESGILFLRSECVSEHGLDLTQSMHISEAAHSMLRRSEVLDGDILLTITGNIGRAVMLSGVGRGNINQHIARVRITSPEAVPEYVFHALSRPSSRRHFTAITTGQAYPQISLQQVREAAVALPPTRVEQEAIAEALSDADALIESLEQLLSKKRQMKQGAIQELLAGRSRLRGPQGKWESKRFSDVADKTIPWSIGGGPFGSNLKSSDYVQEGVRIIQLQNIGDGKFNDDYAIYTSEEKADELLSNNIFPGEIILSKMGDPVARCCFVPSVDQRYLMASDGIRLVVDETRFDKRFVHDYINSVFFRKNAIEASTGSTRQRIGLTELKQLPFVAPPLPEQTAIAGILSDMGAEIDVMEAKLAQARQLKQGMMQELLTGRIRLV